MYPYVSAPAAAGAHVFSPYAKTPVSYTHLTLPTIYSVEISGVAVSLKKKNKQIEQIDKIIPQTLYCYVTPHTPF